ncbi:MAG: response regulator [Spirochaetales bacterium]|nr:response regulator [Spirochaetales bacterium]
MKNDYVIFAADDDPDILSQIKTGLESKGHTVVTASCDTEAEAIISAGGFDCAIIDLMMDAMDSGFVLAHHVKKKDPSIPVVIITAVADETGFTFDTNDREHSVWIKADAILNKDVRIDQLEGVIRGLIKEREHDKHQGVDRRR